MATDPPCPDCGWSPPPDDTPKVIITFERWSHQQAFVAWIASGQCSQALRVWMGRHGYHA